MTDGRSKALVPQDPTSLSPLSRLAQRTLAERVERDERALVTARTLVVGTGGYATINEAVDAARDGDTVLVRPGRYEESIVVEGKTIRIRGDGERDAIVVGWDVGHAFTLVETRSTLTGLTIVGGGPESEVEAGLLVTGGAPQLDGLRVTHGTGLVFEGGAAGAVEHSQIDGNDCGITVQDGASPRIEENEIWETAGAGIWIGGGGTDPLVRANRIHDGQGGGIYVTEGASPRIEENEIWGTTGEGITIRGGGTDPLVRANRIHGQWAGISVSAGASPLIEENEILGMMTGIDIGNAGTDPLVRTNRVHDGYGGGIGVWGGASPRIEENEVWANAKAEITIRGSGTDPLVRANRVHDGHDRGIGVAEGASPRIEENEVWANKSAGIWISGAGTSPVIIGNTVRDGLADGICVLESASPTIGGNTITGNALEAIRVDGDAVPKIGHNVVSP